MVAMKKKRWDCDQKEDKEYQLRSRPSFSVATKNLVLMRTEDQVKRSQLEKEVMT